MSSVVFGQGDYAFKVLANKGTSEVKVGSSWQAVKIGSSLNLNDEIKVPENAYIGLVHVKGKPLELKQAGTYKVSDLAAKATTNTTVMAKYTDFILSSNSAETKKNRLSATGAVSREVPGEVDVFLPADNQNASVYNSTIEVKWESKSKGPFVVIFQNMFDDELMKIETPATSLEVNLNDPKLASESAILVQVKTKAMEKAESKEFLIRRMSTADVDRVKKSLVEISIDPKEENAIDYLLLSSFYENNGLIIDALGAYDKVLKLAPDVPTYKEGYEDFLLRNKLKDPAAK